MLIDLDAAADAHPEVSVEVATVAGVSLFKTQFAVGALGGQATVRLSFPRLGLGEGAHVVTATGWSGDSRPHATSKSLVVAPNPSAFGLIRPEHAWSLEPRPQPQGSEPTPRAAATA